MPWAHQILVSTIGALLIIIIARIIGALAAPRERR